MSDAINTFQTYLMKGTGTNSLTWSKIVDIKDFPDLGGPPEQIEVTTLSDPTRVFIPGIENIDQKSFTANYNSTDFATVKALEGTELNLGIWFGASETGGVYTPDGSMGKFSGKGYLNVYVNGGGVNDPVNMTITATMTKNFVKDS